MRWALTVFNTHHQLATGQRLSADRSPTDRRPSVTVTDRPTTNLVRPLELVSHRLYDQWPTSCRPKRVWLQHFWGAHGHRWSLVVGNFCGHRWSATSLTSSVTGLLETCQISHAYTSHYKGGLLKLKIECTNIPQMEINKLVRSVNTRVCECIANQGGPTHYWHYRLCWHFFST